jgi:hypothetical protein
MTNSNENLTMLTDLYQLTMGAGYFDSNKKDIATFDLFVRKLPENWGFFIANRIEEKIADINKAICPSLIIMDARKIFVTGGPDKGKIENPGLIYASGDRVAIDLVGLDYLLKYRGKENCVARGHMS